MIFTKKVCLAFCFLSFSLLTSCSDTQRRQVAESAIQKAQDEHSSAVASDTCPPVFSCTMEKASYEVNDDIDFDRMILSLTAKDDVDGDVTSKIVQKETDVVEHKEGSYHVVYTVSDSAGNTSEFTLPIEITTKYTSDEKKRLQSCVKAYNKLCDSLKAPSTLSLSSACTDKYGYTVILNFSAQNSFGSYVSGHMLYSSTSDTIVSIEKSQSDSFSSCTYIYDYDELKSFSDYYNP